MSSATIKIYNGYGHSKNLVVYGHVFKGKLAKKQRSFTKKGWRYALALLRLFFFRPKGNMPLRLYFFDQIIETQAGSDGFFKFKWASDTHLSPGLHPLKIGAIGANNDIHGLTEGRVYVAHSTQYVFVSDIDDTVLISHSASLWKRLRELLSKNAERRKIFGAHVLWYRLLSTAYTTTGHTNPFFYVSSSEWNLYDYLQAIFDYNQLPTGSFLLSHFKRWYDFFKTGQTKHEDKYRRISRLLRVYPKQKFVLIGDNSQHDPLIYTALVNDYPDRIEAIYIRNIRPKKAMVTLRLLSSLSANAVYTCMFHTAEEAIAHSIAIGLIESQNHVPLSGFKN